jgi:hypothetical protein
MSKRLDLVIKEQEGTSHQATPVIGGIHFINTGTGHGQYAHSKGISAQPTRSCACDRAGHTKTTRQEGT